MNDRNPEAEPLICPAAPPLEAEQAARALDDTIDLFDDEHLVLEFARLIVVYEEKGWPRTFKGIAGKLGQEFPGTSHPNPTIYEGAKRGSS